MTRKRYFVVTVLIVLLLAPEIGAAKETNLYLYGGENQDIFLGCLTSTKYSADSVWNEYGKYGSPYSSTSIWNDYGTYGSEFSKYSPWNKYSQSAPIIVDDDGNFYGYFSVNTAHKQRTELDFCLSILDSLDNFSGEALPSTSGVIESRINGTFEGWDGETIFKLENGQIWQQSSYSYIYHYAYRPKVLIYKENGSYKMEVESVSKTIRVKRIK